MSLLQRARSRRTRVLVAVLLFALLTLLAIGPLRSFDLALHRPWAELFTPNRVGLLRDTADRIAGQQVNTTVLLVVAVAAMVRSRCWNPLGYAVGAVVGFYVVGLVKIGFSRDSTALGTGADFFRGDFGHIHKFVMSYPSGHTSEAVLIYGTVYAIARLHLGLGARTLLGLRVAWGLVVANAASVSFYLGYHWLTDLLGGVLLGWILLEAVLHLGARVPRLALASGPVPGRAAAGRPGGRRSVLRGHIPVGSVYATPRLAALM